MKAMNDHSNINVKLLLWIPGILLVIILLIVMLSRIDNRRKYVQFKSINEKLLNSEYPKRFEDLTKNFHPDDTSAIKLIYQNLSFIKEDFPEINFSEIYIKDTGSYHKITHEEYRNFSENLEEVRYLPQNLNNYIAYLDRNSKTDIDSLYKFTRDLRSLDLMMKTGQGYLLVRHWRK